VFSVAAEGVLSEVSGSPYATGVEPASVAFSPSGGLLATANGLDDAVSVFSVTADGALSEVSGSPYATGTNPTSVAFAPGGRLLAVSNAGNSNGSTVSMFSVTDDGELSPVTGSPFPTGGDAFSVAFSPGGGGLATANGFGYSMSVFSVSAGGELTQVAGSPIDTGFIATSVAFSANGGLLAVTNENNASVSVVAFGPPSAQILWPVISPDNMNVFNQGESVATSFSCTDAPAGPSISSCTDSNDGSGTAGTLDTSVAGAHTYRVTAVSADGQPATTSVEYDVLAGPPTVSIGSPINGASYAQDQTVTASYRCQDALGAPGLVGAGGCVGPVADGAAIDTATPGSHAFAVTATSQDHQTTTRLVSYTVTPTPTPTPAPTPAPTASTARIGPPTAAIAVPTSQASYRQGQVVIASYRCQDAAGAPGLAGPQGCAGTVADGAQINTATPGSYSFLVTAISQDGQSVASTVSYTVRPPSNQFTVTQLKTHQGGMVSFKLAVPGPGRVAILETVGHGAHASPTTHKLGRGRTVFAQTGFNARAAQTLLIHLKPSARGRKLLRHRRSVTIRLWITYTPPGGNASTLRARLLRLTR